MNKISLAIFANFYINNQERLQRMKDSFYSFKDINPNEWIINIRGNYKHQAGNFLINELGDKLKLFYLQSKKGWFDDSIFISKDISSDYVLFWVEDHILINSLDSLKNCIFEMRELNVDQLRYSFFQSDLLKRFKIEPTKSGNHIKVQELNYENCKNIRKKIGEFYTVSCVSIMRREFFKKILNSPKPFLKRWPRGVPFDFEKLSKDNVEKKILDSIPNKELFVAIDDDHDETGYSLISRGMYPNRVTRDTMKNIEFGYSHEKRRNLKLFFPSFIRPIVLKVYRFFRSIFYTLNIFKN
tara:strand:+ start:72 stop:965 length:894 start_codon:yes stop_codon:yes gene_type:complete